MRLPIPRSVIVTLFAGAMASASAVAGVHGQAGPGAGPVTISGRVIDVGSNGAVPEARVTLALRGQPPQVTTTDSDGAFTFNVPVASGAAYTLLAQKPGYVTPSSIGASPSVSVPGGRSVTGVTLHLQRGAVVAGFVVDPHGHPLASALVRVVHQVKGRWTGVGGNCRAASRR